MQIMLLFHGVPEPQHHLYYNFITSSIRPSAHGPFGSGKKINCGQFAGLSII